MVGRGGREGGMNDQWERRENESVPFIFILCSQIDYDIYFKYVCVCVCVPFTCVTFRSTKH